MGVRKREPKPFTVNSRPLYISEVAAELVDEAEDQTDWIRGRRRRDFSGSRISGSYDPPDL